MTEEVNEGMLPQRKKSDDLEFMENFIERALEAGLTDQETSKALALARYWDTVEPALEHAKKGNIAAVATINAALVMLRGIRPVLVAYSKLERMENRDNVVKAQDVVELDSAVMALHAVLGVFEKKLDEARACLSI